MRKYIIFILLGLGLLIVSISGTSVSVAFPAIKADLDTSLILAGWVLSIPQLMSAISMPIAGKISDIIGRKTIFISSIICFILGSLVSAISPNIWILILSRFLQGIGGGGILPSATGLAVDEFSEKRYQAVGMFSSIFAAGQIIGPNLGGFLVEQFGWRSIFWINIPLGLIVLVPSCYLLKPSIKEKGKIDILGAILLFGALGFFLLALSTLGEYKSTNETLLPIFLVISSCFLGALIIQEKRSKEPIIDRTILTKKPFVAANIYNFIFGAAMLGLLSFIPLYAVSVYDMTTFQSGVIITPRSIALIITSVTASVFILRWGYRRPMIIGSVLIIISFVLMAIEPSSLQFFDKTILNNIALLILIMFISGLGSGIALPAANNACIELMPERVATITGIRGMFRQCGAAISITAISLILQIYQNNMALGFSIIFFGISILMLITIPAIFFMPETAIIKPDKKIR